MKKIASIIVVALIIVAANVKDASAQTESRSWIYLGAGVEKEFSKKFSAELDMQARFCHAKEAQEFLLTPKIEYSPIKFVAIGTEYRAKVSHEKGESSEWTGRFGAWMKAKWSPSILKLEARIKYCNYTDDVQDRDGNYASEKYFRTKFLAGVKLKSIKLTPYISYEWFYEFNRSLVDKDRLTIGLKKKLNKRNALTFEYMFEERFNRGKTKKNINNNIFAFTYQYTFPYKKESE